MTVGFSIKRMTIVVATLVSVAIPTVRAENLDAESSGAEFRITGMDKHALAARIHLSAPDGTPVDPKVPELLFRRDHFVCDGNAGFALDAGEYHYVVEKGPEWETAAGKFVVTKERTPIDVQLKRRVDMPAEGWWAGDTRICREPADVPLLMKAEDLWVGQTITWWNDHNPWAGKTFPASLPVITEDGRMHHPMAGGEERDGGKLLMFGLREPFPLAAYAGKTHHWPLSVFFLEMAKKRGAWIDAGSADSQDIPIWLASGKLDSISIDHNHHDLYFKMLNCGLRVPPSAGSANDDPVGQNRMYVQTGAKPNWQTWWDSVKNGRVMVSNGPLLRVSANEKFSGEVFKTDGGPLQVHLNGQLDSKHPVKMVELIRNGETEVIKLPALVTINESGWFAVRAIAEDGKFALTAPWYVEVGGKQMMPVRDDAQFFHDWCIERIKAAKSAISDKEHLKSALASLTAAEDFWREKTGAAQIRQRVTGRITDSRTGSSMAARVYIRNAAGAWFFPTSKDGTAVSYEKRNWANPLSAENHTTVSAHPWTCDLPAGNYVITVERGKEWTPLVREIEITHSPVDVELPLERWVDMASEGWFSGETHVHRSLKDLPNVMLAEDLNVAFPLTYWGTHGGEAPYHYDKGFDPSKPVSLIQIDSNHVIWPLNTEWEIFTLAGKSHTLGAVFALGHTEPIMKGVPPLRHVAAEAKRQNALLDMDKPDWPWSPALPTTMDIDLYELANNHMWRVPFALTKWFTPAPEWMLPGATEQGGERDWIEYTHRTYWAMLNCGSRLRPSAGTASGVHPVPLGFGRVYVHCPSGFSYESWMDGLKGGRSFVTTGPMLVVDRSHDAKSMRIDVRVRSLASDSRIEVIHNGEIIETTVADSTDCKQTYQIPMDHTGWVAVRVWEPQPDGRVRFAHSAPEWFEVAGKPLVPSTEQKEFLVRRVNDEISRSGHLLCPDACDEFKHAAATWKAAPTSFHKTIPNP